MNMKKYKILMNDNIAIIIATTYISLSDVISNIKKELNKKDYKGMVYFDYLLTNGNNSNRFAKAYFNGEFENFQIIPKNEIEENKLKEIIKKFYQKNYEKYIKNNSILIPALKFRIKKGLEI